MYKARLSQWGISKNYSDRDYQICAVLNHIRQTNGKGRTAFVIHGHKRSLKDLHKYIKGRKMSEDEFLASALKNIDYGDQQQQIQYAHVRAYTPEPEVENDNHDDPHKPSDTATTTTGRLSNASPNNRCSTANLSPTATGTDSVAGSSVSSSCLFLPPYTPSSQDPSPYDNASPAPIMRTPTTHLTPSARPLQSSHLSSSRDSATSAFIWPSQSTPLTPSPWQPPTIQVYEHQHAAADQDTCASFRCQRLGREVEYMALQVVDAPSLKSLCGHDDICSWRLMSDTSTTDTEDFEVICPTCHDLTRDHFISLPNLELPPPRARNILNENGGVAENTISLPASSRGHEHSWKWVARCFAACIYMKRGDVTLSRHSLADADVEFEKVLSPPQDPKVLLAVNQTLQILHMHDEGEVTKTIISSAYKVAERILGPDDPLTSIIRWMTSVADLSMRDGDMTSSTLRSLHTQFVQRHGSTDPRSIASMYCYGYMLNVERQLEQAESVLGKVYELSCVHLGRQHLQSISALTNLHRALERQGRIDDAIDVLERAITDSRETLGRNHPRRLESIRLLGIMHEGSGRMDVAESLYWRVLEGRIKMLGRNHQYTQGMKRDLEALLKRIGKWNVQKQKTSNKGAEGEPTTSPAPGDGGSGSYLNGTGVGVETELVESEAQLRMQDMFEWDPDDKWDDPDTRFNDPDGGGSNGLDSPDDTRSQTVAF